MANAVVSLHPVLWCVAPAQALQSLQAAAVQSGDGDWMNVVLSFIRGDVGLMLFGNAQMFVS